MICCSIEGTLYAVGRTKFPKGGGGGGRCSLDQYKIMKAIKHTCTVVTLYVHYKMTINQ